MYLCDNEIKGNSISAFYFNKFIMLQNIMLMNTLYVKNN